MSAERGQQTLTVRPASRSRSYFAGQPPSTTTRAMSAALETAVRVFVSMPHVAIELVHGNRDCRNPGS
jgi:hypothetical protein